MCNIPGQGTPFYIGWYGFWSECPGDEGQVSDEMCQEWGWMQCRACHVRSRPATSGHDLPRPSTAAALPWHCRGTAVALPWHCQNLTFVMAEQWLSTLNAGCIMVLGIQMVNLEVAFMCMSGNCQMQKKCSRMNILFGQKCICKYHNVDFFLEELMNTAVCLKKITRE